MNNSVFQQNIISLSSINPGLAFSISQCSASEKCEINTSKDGSLVPVITEKNSRYQLHSLYNPVKEGEKIYQSAKNDSGFVIVFGLGGGYHLLPYLNDPEIHHILIIDTDKKILRKVIENIDLGSIFSSRKTDFLIDPDAEDLRENLSEKYNPAIYGNLSIVQLKNRINSDPDFFANIFEEIRDVIDSVSDDFASQAQFGKRWFKNTLYNLLYADEYSKPLSPSSKVLIAGAGPSIERQTDIIRKNRTGNILIATDTVLPFLSAENIKPDIIISIDCQHITYNHFLGIDFDEIPIVLDLSSPSHLSRKFANKSFFSSGHPFSRYIATYWKYFPVIDTSGGNVGHSAVSLAKSLGAKEIGLYGLDYSYPSGKPYARNSLIYNYFMKNETRLKPAENSIYSFVFSNKSNTRIENNIISNSKLDSYYRHLSDFIINNKLNTSSSADSPRNLDFMPENVSFFSERAYSENPVFFSSGSADISWKDFLNKYRARLVSLPKAENSFSSYYQSLTKKEKELWATVFPVCASVRKEHKDEKLDTSYILEDSRNWCIKKINTLLSNS